MILRIARVGFYALFLAVSCLPLYLASCGGGGSSTPAGPSYLRGFGISPQGFPLDYSKMTDFYTKVSGMGHGAAMWNGAWRDNVAGGSDSGTIPAAAPSLMQASATYGFTSVLVFGWRSGTTLYLNVPGNSTNDWTNVQARNLFKNMLVDFVTAYHPPYLFLGNENDFYYEQNPADYRNWISFYDSAYDSVKAASPSTQVGPVFNFEHMAGSGGLNGWTTSWWEAWDNHNPAKVDIVGITVYPWLNYATAAAVPDNVLAPLFARIGSKPVAITETGWPAENFGGRSRPWTILPQQQVDYIPRIFSSIAGKDVRIVNWTFLYPMVDDGTGSDGWMLFGSVSLLDNAAGQRPAYPLWVSR